MRGFTPAIAVTVAPEFDRGAAGASTSFDTTIAGHL
jgi:hypothetical protein